MAEVPADPGKEVLSSREQWETPAGLTLLFPAPFVSRDYSRDHNTPLKCSSNGAEQTMVWCLVRKASSAWAPCSALCMRFTKILERVQQCFHFTQGSLSPWQVE